MQAFLRTERPGVGFGIVDGSLDLQQPEVNPMEPLGDVQSSGLGASFVAIEPILIIESSMDWTSLNEMPMPRFFHWLKALRTTSF